MQILVGLVLGLGTRTTQIVLNFERGDAGAVNPAIFAFNAVSNIGNGTIATIMPGTSMS